ncbi:MAG: lactate dehydrogenase [Methylococcaceae bacterium]|nr:lactate dehydrogenase [Methylococcaceae bacterium]MCI0733733.1 lactate dehydrogenase [Methylococcaceae bacterium]
MKISIVGVGRVGSTLAYTILMKGLGDEMVLIGRTPEVAKGEAYDLQHAQPLLAKQMRIRQGSIEDAEASDIVVLAASVPTNPKMSSRMELSQGNAELFRELIPIIAAASPQAILVIVSNPVDVLTYAAIQFSGFPSTRVIGTGTLIDSARYRSMLSSELSIHPDDVRAYILGEHGETQFPAMSIAQAGGVKLLETETRRKFFEEAVDAGFMVFRHKGFTNFAISLATCTIIEAIVFDTCRTMPVSTLLCDYYGIRDVCMSLPVVVGRAGITRVLQPTLNDSEMAALKESAQAIRREIDSVLRVPG